MSRTAAAVIDLVRRLVTEQAGMVVKPGTVLVGLAGRGIQASRTPFMHEREGARLGMTYVYVLIDFDKLDLSDDELGAAVAAAQALGFAGLNITHPFKQTVIEHLGALSAEAAAIGAVNTVVFDGQARTGHNTDCWGFAEGFRDEMAGCSLGRVLQFGAGGAGAAVAYALIELGAGHIDLVDSNQARAEALAARLSRETGAQVTAATASASLFDRADGIVNTTPVGMAKYPGTPFAPALLAPRHWLAEVIYFPSETELLRLARARGCRTLGGRGMAVHQAVRAFELFTGQAPDRAAMARHFEAAA